MLSLRNYQTEISSFSSIESDINHIINGLIDLINKNFVKIAFN